MAPDGHGEGEPGAVVTAEAGPLSGALQVFLTAKDPEVLRPLAERTIRKLQQGDDLGRLHGEEPVVTGVPELALERALERLRLLWQVQRRRASAEMILKRQGALG